jgi:hypothetical protein
MSDEPKEVTVLKITNPLYVGEVAKLIADYALKLGSPTITYETLYAYFCATVQFGGDKAEFTVAFLDQEPIAFAHWFVKGLPYRGVVCCDHIASWNRMADPVSRLIEQFVTFAQKHNAPYCEGEVPNESLYKVIKKAASRAGCTIDHTGKVYFLGRK